MLRVAYLANFSPKKLGTGEGRLIALSNAAADNGVELTLYCHTPVHPLVQASFRDSGNTIRQLGDVRRGMLRSALDLAKNFDAIVLNAISPRSKIALAAYLAWPAKVFYVDHNSGPADEPDYRRQALWRRLLDRLTVARVFRLAGVSNYVRDRLVQRFGLNPERVRTLYGGVDVDRYAPIDTSSARDYFQITVVAALIAEKGVDVLLEAVSKFDHENWRLRVAGEGPEQHRLQQIAKNLGIENRVDFLGVRDDVDAILHDTDIFVHPATWNEALGYTILEGMASGCAVVAARTGAVPEIIEDGSNGLLVEPGNAEDLSTKLMALYKEPAERARLGRAARSTIVENFSLERNVDETFRWLEECARPQPGRRSGDR